MTAKLLALTVPLTRKDLSKPPEKILAVRAPPPVPDEPAGCCRRRTLQTVTATIKRRANASRGPSRGPRFFCGEGGAGAGAGSKGVVTGAGAPGDARPALKYSPLNSFQ